MRRPRGGVPPEEGPAGRGGGGGGGGGEWKGDHPGPGLRGVGVGDAFFVLVDRGGRDGFLGVGGEYGGGGGACGDA